jgi:hypothetical protein
MARSLIVATLIVVSSAALLAGGCSAEAPTVASPVPVAATPSALAALEDEPPGTVTCHLLVAAIKGATLMDPGVVDAIVRASATADAPVADSAQRLAAAYASAVTSKGTQGEADAVAAVSAAGTDMSGVCADSGLESAG